MERERKKRDEDQDSTKWKSEVRGTWGKRMDGRFDPGLFFRVPPSPKC